MTARRQDNFVLRGPHVLAMLLAFFGAVIAVNAYFAFAAVETFPGEDVTHPYIQGLEYNRTLAERRAQQAQGWHVSAGLERSGAGAALAVQLRRRNGAPLLGARMDGALRWPADRHRDRVLTFHEVGDGRYVADLGRLGEGDWDLRATATAPDHHSLDFEADLRWPLAR
jgi:nitrogen fixation protein FixH